MAFAETTLMDDDSKNDISGTAEDRAPGREVNGDLQGRVALVAGGRRGAGGASARAGGEGGAAAYGTRRTRRVTPGRRPAAVDEPAELATGAGGRGSARRGDHTRPREVEALCGEIGQDAGGIDILVN